MYKQINLGRIVRGLTLVGMLDGHVMSAGLNGGHHEYYYVQDGDLRKIRFDLNGALSSDYSSELSFNKILGIAMSVAGNSKNIPRNLNERTESDFKEASKNYQEVICTHEYYTSVYGKRAVSLSKFLENVANTFPSDDASEILNSKTFVVGITHSEFKKIIRGEK